MDVTIVDARPEDLEAILALQKIAYRSEAELYDDFSIPPLVQTLDEIEADFRRQLFLKAVSRGGVVGSVRAHEKNGVCFIGRLIVDPNLQNKGVGARLTAEVEKRFGRAKRFELFTGSKSEKNLYFYRKLGYSEFKREALSGKLTLIFLEKAFPSPSFDIYRE